MIKLLRNHLLNNKKLVSLLSKSDGIFHEERPLKRDDKTYVVIKDKLLSGRYIKEYQITFHIVSDEIEKTLAIEKELIDYLNDARGENIIKDNDTYIRNIQVLNGGGRIRTPEYDYMSVVYFLLKK